MKTHTEQPNGLMFQPRVFAKWLERVDTIVLAFKFAYAGRYMMFMSASDLERIESIIQDALGHLSAVQHLFAGKHL